MTSLSENTVVTTSGGLVELAYVQKTNNVTVTNTGANPDEIMTPVTVVCDGSPIIVEYFSPAVYPPQLANYAFNISLYQNGTAILYRWAELYNPASAFATYSQHLVHRLTPPAGVHTFGVKGFVVPGGTGTIVGGVGGASGISPMFIRISKVVQASQFIVPLASAPLVTSLPSTGNIDGQEVRYLIDDTNGTIWNLRWRASANRWEPISGFESDRNRIINGAMLIDQRRAYTAVNSQTDVYIADRFRFIGAGGGNVNVQTVTNDGPTGISQNSAKITVAIQDTSLAAGDFYLLRQGIEGNMVQDLGFGTSANRPITISFYVKSSVTGTFGGSIRNPGDTRCYVFTYTINAANTWERKIISLTADNTGTWGTGSNNGFFLVWSLGHGSNATSTTTGWQAGAFNQVTGCTNLMATASATWQLSGVQLELGPTATTFQIRDIETELGKCQRYFERMGLVSNAAGADYQNYFYNTTKRVAPTSHIWYSVAPSPNSTPNFRDKNYFTLDGRSTTNTGHDIGVSAEIS
jgi:hypothetical protein